MWIGADGSGVLRRNLHILEILDIARAGQLASGALDPDGFLRIIGGNGSVQTRASGVLPAVEDGEDIVAASRRLCRFRRSSVEDITHQRPSAWSGARANRDARCCTHTSAQARLRWVP